MVHQDGVRGRRAVQLLGQHQAFRACTRSVAQSGFGVTPESSILAKPMAKKVWLHCLCEAGHEKRLSLDSCWLGDLTFFGGGGFAIAPTAIPTQQA